MLGRNWRLEAGEEAAAGSAVNSGEEKLCSQELILNSSEDTNVSREADTMKAHSWS